MYITAADAKALYPSLQRHLVNEALEDALKKHSCYNRIVRQIIAELNNICLENVITQYGSCLYKQRGGIVTGTIIQSHWLIYRTLYLTTDS